MEVIYDLAERYDYTEYQPLFPFISVTIGGTTVTDFQDDMTDSPMSLSYNRKLRIGSQETGNEFSLELYDDTAIEIEYLLYTNLLTPVETAQVEEIIEENEMEELGIEVPEDDSDSDSDSSDDDSNNDEDADKKSKLIRSVTARRPRDTENDDDDKDEDENEDKDEDSESENENNDDSENLKNEDVEENVKTPNNPEANLIIEYGWADKNGRAIVSNNIYGMFTEYKITFTDTATVLSIDGVSSSVVDTSKVDTTEFPGSLFLGSPSIIVRYLCEQEGIEIGQIEDTEPTYDDEGNYRTFTRNNETVMHFIKTQLETIAVSSSTGVTGYDCWIGEDNKLYFVSTNVAKNLTVSITTESSTETNKTDKSKKNTKSKDKDDDDKDEKMYRAMLQPRADSNSSYDTVYIGDSRTVGMYNTIYKSNIVDSMSTAAGNDYWSAKVGGNIANVRASWNSAKSGVDKNNTKLIIMSGVNDLHNITSYQQFLQDVVDNQCYNVSFVSVNPVVEGKTSSSVTNAKIEEFNAAMKDFCAKNGINYIDTYSEVKSMLEENPNLSPDGLHYSGELYQTLYDDINAGAGSEGSGLTSDSGGEVTASSQPPSKITVTAYYEYYSGRRNNQVISFSPDWTSKVSNAAMLMSDVAAVDEVRNQIINLSIAENEKSDVYVMDVINEGKSLMMGRSSDNMQKLANSALSLWNYNYRMVNDATLEIMGDPNVRVKEWIYVSVYTKYGFLHHTSGIYFVEEATDTVDGGSFVTTLTLKKNAWEGFGEEGNAGSEAQSGMGDVYLGRDDLAWPLPEARGITAYTYAGHTHHARDFQPPTALWGTPVVSCLDGTVVAAGNGVEDWSYGNSVYIDHGDGWKSRYAHLDYVSVSPGDTVKKGQIIGGCGSTGNSSGLHLHMELCTPSGWVDPYNYYTEFCTPTGSE